MLSRCGYRFTVCPPQSSIWRLTASLGGIMAETVGTTAYLWRNLSQGLLFLQLFLCNFPWIALGIEWMLCVKYTVNYLVLRK